MRIEGGGDVEAGGVIILHFRNGGFENMADFPELRSFVHIFIEPFFASRQVEFLNQVSQLSVK